MTSQSPAPVMIVYGTRPEAIKLAPLVRLLERDPDLTPYVVVTGQHREMLDQVNGFFEIEPHRDLDLMVHGASVSAVAQRVLHAMEETLALVQPSAVVVQGDTTSAFAASLAAFLAGVPVVHVEAGLRTGNLASPFPEEANRRLTAVVTRLHLAPTPLARANLVAEGIDPATIRVTGNTVVDALRWAVDQRVEISDPTAAQMGRERPFVLVTTHRREAWGGPMRSAMQGLGDVAGRHPGVDFLLPMHRNPVVREAVTEAVAGRTNVHLTEPLGYPEFAHVMQACRLVVTDSGGIQEEAPSLAKPVLVLRNTTERPEGVAAGTVRLVGTHREDVRDAVDHLLVDPDAHAEMANAINPYGDGQAARRCLDSIRSMLLGSPAPEEFAGSLTVTTREGH